MVGVEEVEAPKERKEGVVPRVELLEGRRAGDFLDVMVGEIYSPDKFYLQVIHAIQPPPPPSCWWPASSTTWTT